MARVTVILRPQATPVDVKLDADAAQSVPIELPPTDALVQAVERAEKAAEKAEKAAENIAGIDPDKVVVDIEEPSPGVIRAKTATGEGSRIKVVKTVNGKLADESGNIEIDFPFTVKILGDSKI